LKKNIFALLLITSLFYSCKKEGCTDPLALNYNPDAEINNGSCDYFNTTPYEIEIPYGFPDMIIPEENPMSMEGVELGKKLFNDPILSINNSISCASCHIQSFSFSDPNQFSFGTDGIHGTRNASAIINAGWHTSLNWDGSAMSLEEQAFEPIRNTLEMNNSWQNVENRLNQDEEYKLLFKNSFNIDYIDSNHIVKAIAQFERSLISNNSRFDKYIRGELQLSPSELNGYAIFNTEKADCFHCHGTNLFTDNLFHNNGLDTDPFQDLGLGKITGEINDNGKFKTPTLRNIALTAPYMHDGRFQTLEEVIEHYDNGGHYSSTIDPLMKKLGIGLLLTNQEKQDLIAFLHTLSDVEYIND
tara:strand:+ start:397 stop:1470 length:1074 start_codon:yes stop_codon:yes gene_type:complete